MPDSMLQISAQVLAVFAQQVPNLQPIHIEGYDDRYASYCVPIDHSGATITLEYYDKFDGSTVEGFMVTLRPDGLDAETLTMKILTPPDSRPVATVAIFERSGDAIWQIAHYERGRGVWTGWDWS